MKTKEEPFITFKTDSGDTIEWFVCSRRKYPNCTYTWMYCEVNGTTLDRYFEPWPAVNWPKSALLWETRALGFHITPKSNDLIWAKKMLKQKKFFNIRQEDLNQFFPDGP